MSHRHLPHADTVSASTQYVLTTSLHYSLAAFKRIGLEAPDRAFAEDVEAELSDALGQAFAGSPTSVVTVSFSDLCDSIATMLHRARGSRTDIKAVSTAPLLSFDTGGLCLEVNRLVGFDGKMLGIAGRPGHPSVREQVNRLAGVLKDQGVIIVEDGAFTGGTICHLLEELQARQVHVEAVILGILFPGAEESIRRVFKGKLEFFRRLDNPIDWMPSHDFFPFLPNAGRVVGNPVGKWNHPIYTPSGMHLCMPYLLPYGSPADWASVPAGAAEHAFSTTCLQLTARIFSEMERLNGRPIRVADIAGSYPAAGFPVIRGSGLESYPTLDARILDVIHGDLELIS